MTASPKRSRDGSAERDAVGDAGTDAAESGGDEKRRTYTIDELAAVSGIPSRTIRFYQSKGALQSPERKGRIALYDDSHRERLTLIAELQDRGLQLSAIRDLLSDIEAGHLSLEDWLGLGQKLQARWSDDQPRVFTQTELEKFLGKRRPALIPDMVRVGLLERQGEGLPPMYLARSPTLVQLAMRLEASGIDVETSAGAEAIMRKRLGRACDELVDYFDARAGRGFGDSGGPASVAAAFEALRPLGGDAVRLVFAQEMERALREFIESGGVRPSRQQRPPRPAKGRPSERRRR